MMIQKDCEMWNKKKNPACAERLNPFSGQGKKKDKPMNV